MAYDWVEHTGELELAIVAPSQREVFEEGFDAMCELLACEGGRRIERTVVLEGRDLAVLLADWLNELVVLAETDGLVPERLELIELRDDRLCARIEGRRGAPPHLVKAATYHRLTFDRTGDGWRARVVLDV